MIETFLLGIIATLCFVSAMFFLRFWRASRDSFFLWFAASFFLESVNRSMILLLDRPNEGSPLIYAVRFFNFLLILIAILRKNYAKT